MGKKSQIILIDADIISHFISAGELPFLPKIFPHEIKVLDKVYAELERFPKRHQEVENLLKFKLIELMPFPEEDAVIKKEYFYIKKSLFKGDGESACLAVARHQRRVLASSNLKDIKGYCEMHKIQYLTTMDFICEALKNEVFDHDRCCSFVQKVIKAGSKLPTSNFTTWTCRTVEL